MVGGPPCLLRRRRFGSLLHILELKPEENKGDLKHGQMEKPQ